MKTNPSEIAFAALCALVAATATGCGGPGATSEGRISEAITGGQNDSSDPISDTVVRLTGPSGTCTGTFITPTAVITAHHCVYGDSSGKPGLSFPITVTVGATNGSPIAKYWVRSLAQTAVLSPPGPQTVGVAQRCRDPVHRRQSASGFQPGAGAWVYAHRPAVADRAVRRQ
jgi:hypothetical protein